MHPQRAAVIPPLPFLLAGRGCTRCRTDLADVIGERGQPSSNQVADHGRGTRHDGNRRRCGHGHPGRVGQDRHQHQVPDTCPSRDEDDEVASARGQGESTD